MAKTKTKADAEHLAKVAALGCLACRKSGHRTDAEVHHIRETAGIGQRAGHDETIPLCPAHHRGTMHPVVSSIHLDRRVFIEMYGTELELLAETERLLNEVK